MIGRKERRKEALTGGDGEEEGECGRLKVVAGE